LEQYAKENSLKTLVEQPSKAVETGILKHVIITRYFTRQTKDPNEVRAWRQNSAAWLENRLELFKKFCLPSVLAQSDQNFTWLLYFDEETPEAYLDQIRELIDGRQNIRIRLCGYFYDEDPAADVRAELDTNTKWVLTSRLDNDDGWHRDFVKNLQSQVRFEQREFLNFPTGIIYYRDRTYLFRHHSNAFVSFVEPADHVTTVLCKEHLLVNQVAPVRQLVGPPAFMQVVHGKNVSNKPRGMRIPRLLALNGFEAMSDLFTTPIVESDAEILFENITVSTAWMVRDWIIDRARRAKARFS
jgi:hypothetical protein